MTTQLRPALVSLTIFTILTGLVYPIAVTEIAQMAYPNQANGSLLVLPTPGVLGQNREIVGSALIGQSFDDPGYFWGRLSATVSFPYNAAASSGSNLGPLNDALIEAARARADALRAAEPGNTAPIPVDLVTASGSGLDPHISPAAAQYQVPRVAKARGLAEETVRRLVAQHTEGPQFGLLGEPRVNVLTLNLAIEVASR